MRRFPRWPLIKFLSNVENTYYSLLGHLSRISGISASAASGHQEHQQHQQHYHISTSAHQRISSISSINALAASAHQQHPCISSIRASKNSWIHPRLSPPSHPQKSSQTLYCSPLTQLWPILAGRNPSLHWQLLLQKSPHQEERCWWIFNHPLATWSIFYDSRHPNDKLKETLPEAQRTQKLTPRLGLNLATTWRHLH